MKIHYRTIILSDVHLGSSGSKAKEATQFLKSVSCETLILNGDIIDGWQLRKFGSWKMKHTNFFRAVLKMMDRHKTKVIYLRGNHDDFLDQVMPLLIGKYFHIKNYHVLQSGAKKFYIIHGDVFDSITSQMKWLANLGDYGYTFLLWINKLYNAYRESRGLPYYSLSQKIKAKVKLAVNYVSDYEEKLTALAKAKDCNGIICGHIHQAAIKDIDGITYMNSGDWVESMTALVEGHDNQWEIVHYSNLEPQKQELEIVFNNHEEKNIVYSPK